MRAPTYRVSIRLSEWRGWNGDGYAYFTNKRTAQQFARTQGAAVIAGRWPGRIHGR